MFLKGSPTERNKSDVKDLFVKVLLSEYFIVFFCLLIFVSLMPVTPHIASRANINNIMSNLWPLFIIAIGQTVVLIVAGIDLSQTSIIAITSVVGAAIMTSKADPTLFEKSPLWGWFLTESGGPLAGEPAAIYAAIFVMILIGVGIGCFNGFFIHKFKMPPFMVTLVSQMLFSALAIYLTKSENIIGLPKNFKAIGSGSIMKIIPYSMIFAIVVAVLAAILLNKTVLGKWLYLVGSNPKASAVIGVPTGKVIIFAYAFSGFCAAMGSVLLSARLIAGRPTLGQTMLMDVVGAAVIGGTSLFGGKGKVSWTLFGALFFVILANALNMMKLPFYVVDMAKGIVIIIAVAFDVLRIEIKRRTNVM